MLAMAGCAWFLCWWLFVAAQPQFALWQHFVAWIHALSAPRF